MTFTRHGHHIVGSYPTESPSQWSLNCGGPGLCTDCSRDASKELARFFVSSPQFSQEIYIETAKAAACEFFNERRPQTTPAVSDDQFQVRFAHNISTDGWEVHLALWVPREMVFIVQYSHARNSVDVELYWKIDASVAWVGPSRIDEDRVGFYRQYDPKQPEDNTNA